MSICLNPSCGYHNLEGESWCQQCGQSLLLGGRYRLLREIGAGGFGKTYFGIDDPAPGHPACAIKQFLPTTTENQTTAARLFQQEAERLSSLDHPQIPKFLGYFTVNDQQYIIQELIAGATLAEELDTLGPFSASKIRDLLTEILPILDYLHNENLIHRDIKPANLIRRSQDHRLFLVDFGATKVVTGTQIAKTGTRIGTAEFVAPEQLRGKAVFASDLYSLGVTCIHLLTQTSPFEMIDSHNQWVWRDYLPDHAIDPQLGKILDRLIEPALSQRYSSARQVLQALLEVPPVPGEIVTRRQISWLPIIGITFGVSILVAFLTIVLWKSDAPTSPELPVSESPIPLVPAPSEPLIPKTSPAPEPVSPQPIDIPAPPKPVIPEVSPALRETSSPDLDFMKLFFNYVQLQNDHYLAQGKFLESPAQMIASDSHYFTVQPIDHGIQVAAIPRQEQTYGYVAVLWGGKLSDADQKRLETWQPQDPTDIGTFSLPNFTNPASEYTTRVTYCESVQTVSNPPPLTSVPGSLPLSTHELPCPPGYAFSQGIIESIGKLAAETLPAQIRK